MVSPPSRGRRKAGAFAPSANSDLRPADASGFPPDGLLAAGLFALGLAAAVFDSAAARDVDSPARGDFDFCVAGLQRRFARNLRLDAGRLAGGGLGGFLARFLGHTPSFRRFRRINHGSIAGLAPACRNKTDCWASLMVWEYGYKEFDARPVGSLNAFLGPDEKLQY